MSLFPRVLKPLMPIIATVFGFTLIYVTSLPMLDEGQSVGGELLSWLLTSAAIVLTYYIVFNVEPKVFQEAAEFPPKRPDFKTIAVILLIAPLFFLVQEYIVYGLASLCSNLQMEPLTYSAEELREDLFSSIHAVLLAPVLEELCFRQMAVSPFRRRGTQVVVCIVMALLFGMLHIRNFAGSAFGALAFGLVFVSTHNIWYSVALHAGNNLIATLLAIYCWLDLGEIKMSHLPVIMIPDIKVLIASIILAAFGVYFLTRQSNSHFSD